LRHEFVVLVDFVVFDFPCDDVAEDWWVDAVEGVRDSVGANARIVRDKYAFGERCAAWPWYYSGGRCVLGVPCDEPVLVVREARGGVEVRGFANMWAICAGGTFDFLER